MLRIIRLEQRILFDASASGVIADAANSESNAEQHIAEITAETADQDTPEAVIDSPISPHQEVNVLLISSKVDHAQELAAMTSEDVTVVLYDSDNDTLGDIFSQVEEALDGQLADTIGFATHGDSGFFHITKDIYVTADNIDHNAELKSFWKDVGTLLQSDGRIDLLSSNIAANDTSLLAALAGVTDADIAASSDITGNGLKQDWHLEVGDIDASTYFNGVELARWSGSLDDVNVTNLNNLSIESERSEAEASDISVLLISSETEEAEVLADAAADNVITIFYDANNNDLNALYALVESALNGQKADSIAFATHGQTGQFALTHDTWVSAESLSENASLLSFWSNIGVLLNDGGRVDLLGCNIAGIEGNDFGLLSALDAALDSSGNDIQLAASTDMTGNGIGENWTLEVGNVDASSYFDQAALAGFSGSLATFTVTNTNNSGGGSLRQAIIDANASGDANETINFSISAASTITLTSGALPTLTGGITIDGTTATGYSFGVSMVTVNFNGFTGFISSGGNVIQGLDLTGATTAAAVELQAGDTSTISSNVIHGNQTGIEDNSTTGSVTIGGTLAAEGNVIFSNTAEGIITEGTSTIQNNIIGLQSDGNTAAGNGTVGIKMTNAPGGGIILENVISSNTTHGIDGSIVPAGTITIQDNIIGLNQAGDADRGNLSVGVRATNGQWIITGNTISGNNDGIQLTGGVDAATVTGNQVGTNLAGTAVIGNSIGIITAGTNTIIGGTTVADRNIIGGSTNRGIRTNGLADIQGNYIGLASDGTTSLGNSTGITIQGGAVGGGTISDNVISSNSGVGGEGIVSQTSFTGTQTIENNLIGTDASGNAARGNRDGIRTQSGTFTIRGNTISGNSDFGIHLQSGTSASIIESNFIGTNSTGTAAISNTNSGIRVENDGNTIGGTSAAQANTIGGNLNHGIIISGSNSNTISNNYIGTNAAGDSIGNTGDGINIVTAGAASNNVISENVIAFNTVAGVKVDNSGGGTANGNLITGNSIYSNTGIGIDLVGTANDSIPAATGVTGTYVAGTTTLTIDGSFSGTNGTYTVEYFHTPAADGSNEGRTFLGSETFVVSGGTGTFSEAFTQTATPGDFATVTITNASNSTSEFSSVGEIPNDPPEVDLDGVGGDFDFENTFTKGLGPVNITDSDATVTDTDHPDLQSMTVTLTNRPDGALESLAFTPVGSINGSYTPATGILALTGTGTLAEYQQVLRSVTYNNTSGTPNTTNRIITVTVSDGIDSSNVATSTITVVANTPPVVTAGGILNYDENDPATAVDNTVTVSDSDDTNLESATIQITSNYQNGEDLLAFTNTVNITGIFDTVTGTMTLTGTDTLLNYQTALRSVTYQNSSETPSELVRTVTFIANDGDDNSSGVTSTINVTAVNDPPINSVPGAQVTNEDVAIVFNAGNGNLISVSDVDIGSDDAQVTLTATNGTVTLSGITGLIFDAGDGTDDAVMTFRGTTSEVNTALNGLTFDPTPNFSGGANLQVITNDQGSTGTGGALSDTDNISITVNAVNDPPVLTAGGTLNYTENDLATAIDNTVTVNDVDDTNIESATIQITSNYQNGEDLLAFIDTVNITGSFNAPSGTLTLTGTDTLLNYQTALRSVTYQNNSESPSELVRTVTFIVNDGNDNSSGVTSTINVTAVNDPPINSVPGAQVTNEDVGLVFNAGNGNLISVSDADIASNDFSITLTATNGTVTLSGTTGLLFDAGDGTSDAVMTFRGTTSEVNTALNGLTFDPTPEYSGGANLEIITNDQGSTGTGGALSDTDNIPITVNAVNDPPVLTAGGTLNYTENDLATAIDNTVTVNDVDDTNIESATIQITSNYQNGEDLLAFIDTVNITGSFNAPSGTLTLTGTDTLANYQTALRSVTYANSSENPSGLSRTVTFIVNDGTDNSTGDTSTINVTPINDAPVVTAGATLNYTENDTATVIDNTVTVNDVDDTNIESATIQITNNYQNGQDLLAFADTGSITGSFNAVSGTLTLTGSDTLANYQTALRSVTYANSSEDPSGLSRTVTFIVNDGTDNSTGVTSTINVTPVNDPPVLTAGGTLNYTENDLATVIDNTVTVNDVDDTNIESATIQITSNYQNGEDLLAFIDTVNITGSFNAPSGTLTLTGTDTLLNYQTALRSVTYQNNSEAPSELVRTVTFIANDGNDNSSGVTSTINVTAVNDPPINSVPGAQVTNEDVGLVFNAGNGNLISVSDVDIASNDFSITLTATNGTVTLSGITGLIFDAGDGTDDAVMTFRGTTSEVNAALNGLTFDPTPEYSGGANLEIVTNDQGSTGTGGALSDTDNISITVNAVNDPPVLTAGGTLNYTENDLATAIDNTVTVNDVDDTNIESATIQITSNYQNGEDLLAFIDTVNITGSFNAPSGTLTLTGTDTLLNYQTALRSVTYQNNSEAPSELVRTVTFIANDGDDNSSGVTSTINVTAVNDPPINSVPGAQVTNEDVGLVFNAGNGNLISVSDVDIGSNDAQVTLTATNGTVTLSGITGLIFDAGDGTDDAVMTFRGTAAEVNTALNGLTFDPTPNFSGGANLQVITNDQGSTGTGGALSDTDNISITVNAVNDPPVLTAGGTLNYTENDLATAIDNTVTVNDVDDTNIESATIQITSNYQNGEDLLAFIDTVNITGSFNAPSGTLTLTGTDTLLNYQTALRSVTYQNNSEAPSELVRTVTFIANDGNDNSSGVTSTINVTAVNDPPINSVPGAQVTNEDVAIVFNTGNGNLISVSDVDIGSNDAQVTLTATNGTVTLSGITGLLFDAGDGTDDALMTFRGTASEVNAALNGLTFDPTPNFSGGANLQIITNDQGSTGTGGALSDTDNISITVNAVNDPPVLTAGGTLNYTENDLATAIDNTVTVNDVDDTNIESATIQITSNYQNGEDLLAFIDTVNITGSFNAPSGTLTLTGTDTLLNYQTALRSVTYQNNSESPSELVRTVTFIANDGNDNSSGVTSTINVTAVNDPPINSVPGAQVTNEDVGVVFNAGNGNLISVSDVDIASNDFSITLTATNGTVTLSGTTGLLFDAGDGTDDAVMTFRGTTSEVNTALNGLTFDPTPNFSGGANLQIITNDQGSTGTGGALSDTDNISITVNAVNDPPVLTAGGTLNYTENDLATAIDNTVTVNDVDDTNIESATIQITSNYQNGEDLLAFIDTVNITGSFNAPSGTLTLTGTDTLLNYQTALRSVTYQNNSEAPSELVRTVTFIANDGNDNSSGVTSTINVTAVNDPPINSVPGAQVTNEDVAIVFNTGNGNLISVSDVDIGSNDAQVTLTATNGTVTLSGTTGLLFDAGDGTDDAVMTFRGTTSEVNAALDGLTFDPTPNFGGGANLQIITNDQGSTGTGGAQSDTDNISITVNAVNDPPVLTAGGTLNYTENDLATAIDNTVTVNDVDDTNIESATIQITSNYQNGEDLLAFIDTVNITGSFNATNGTLTLTGTDTLANYQTALRSVTYQNNSETPSELVRTVTFIANDGNDNSSGVTSTINVAAVNDPPINSVPGAQVTNEDVGLLFNTGNGNLISISDVDIGGDDAQVTLTATNGTVTLSGITGLAFTTGDGTADAVMTFTGNLASINAALDGLTFDPTPNFNGGANLQILTNDQGFNGTGGALSDTDNISITVNAVDDPAVITNNGSTVTEGGTDTIAQSELEVTDVETPDPANISYTVTVVPVNGQLELTGNPGVSITSFTQAQINGNQVVYIHNGSETTNDTFTFNVTTSTDGLTNQVFTITVSPVNDNTPVANNDSIVVDEGASATTLVGGATSVLTNDTDADAPGDTLTVNDEDGVTPGIQIVSGPTFGILTINSDGTFNYTHDGSENFIDSFVYRVFDGVNISGNATVNITINPVNDTPPDGADKLITISEDGSHTFSPPDFGFTDSDTTDTLQAVRIDTINLTGSATLELAGVDVSATDVIAFADLTNLVFRPAANASGTSSFTFSVQDSSGFFDLVPNTMTLDVTAVNDTPLGTDKTVAVDEDNNRLFLPSDFGYSDVEGDAFQAIRIDSFTLPPGATLQFDNGVTTDDVTIGQVISSSELFNLIFTPKPDDQGVSYANFTFSVQDAQGAFDAATNTLTIDVNNLNDAPTGANNNININEDGSHTFANGDFGFSDIDLGESMTAVRIDTLSLNGGTLKLGAANVTASQVITFAEIVDLTYRSPTNQFGSNFANFTFSVRDSVNVFSSSPNTMNFNVASVNDIPTASDNTINVNEDESHTFVKDDFNFSDIDAGDDLSAVRIDSLNLVNGATLELSSVPVLQNDVILLAQIANLVFTPGSNDTASSSFTFSVRDNASAFSASSQTMTLDVTPVNDAPTGANNTINVNEDNTHTFGEGDFGFADAADLADELSNVRIDSLTLVNGATLKLSGTDVLVNDSISRANLVNLVFRAGSNDSATSSFTFSVQDNNGTFSAASNTITLDVAPVNDAPTGADNTIVVLEDQNHTFAESDFGFADSADPADQLAAIRIDTLNLASGATLKLGVNNVTAGQVIITSQIVNLVFTPDGDANGTNYSSFTFSVQDDNGAFSAASSTMTIDVTSVNDAPSSADNTITINEDNSHTFIPPEFSFTDAEDTIFKAIRIDSFTLPPGATLKYLGSSVTPGLVIPRAFILGLVFNPAANANGLNHASFTFSIQDSNDAFSASSNTMTIDVTPVNDAPTGSENTIIIQKNNNHSFLPGDFGYSDVENDSFQAVRIDTLNLGTGASLTFMGSAVTAGQVIDFSQIIFLEFSPATDAVGTNNSSFSFSVQDGVGAFDTDPNTITIDIEDTMSSNEGIQGPSTVGEAIAFIALSGLAPRPTAPKKGSKKNYSYPLLKGTPGAFNPQKSLAIGNRLIVGEGVTFFKGSRKIQILGLTEINRNIVLLAKYADWIGENTPAPVGLLGHLNVKHLSYDQFTRIGGHIARFQMTNEELKLSSNCSESQDTVDGLFYEENVKLSPESIALVEDILTWIDKNK